MNRRGFVSLAATALAGAGCQARVSGLGRTRVSHVSYRGWADALRLDNGLAEVVIVPSLGRVMQFGFAGDEGVFWENPVLAGRGMPEDPWATAMGSFGGDKTWPAPQALWNWPPPDIFDRAPLLARIEDPDTVILTSAVSARFGIRTERRIALESHKPVLRIRTTYHKVEGPAVECAVWIITQLRDPERVFLPIPKGTRFPSGWSAQWKIPANLVTVRDGMVSVRRQTKGSFKVGNDATSLLWMDARQGLRIDIERVADAVYPDEGCSVEVYTNPDPIPYVELETLAPLRRMEAGQTAMATNVYGLFRRGGGDMWEEARALLSHSPPGMARATGGGSL